jgi:hypothetical protein
MVPQDLCELETYESHSRIGALRRTLATATHHPSSWASGIPFWTAKDYEPSFRILNLQLAISLRPKSDSILGHPWQTKFRGELTGQPLKFKFQPQSILINLEDADN